MHAMSSGSELENHQKLENQKQPRKQHHKAQLGAPLRCAALPPRAADRDALLTATRC